MHVVSALAVKSRIRLERLLGSQFVRNVGVLAGGTALAQALAVLVLPLLTRLYTPAHFSVLAVYVSLLGIISVAACLRLEIAIPMPERDDDAINLLALALCSSTVFGALAMLAVWIFPAQITALVHQPALRPYLWMLPLGIWLTGIYAAFQYWATRKHKFSAIARTGLTQSLGRAVTQVGLGWAGLAPFGLLFGQMINSGAGVVSLGRDVFRDDRIALKAISLANMRYVFREYDRFPKYSTFEGLANTAGIQLPIIVIAALAVGPEAGYLMLATRAMAAPMTLVGSSVAQVYLSRAPEELRRGNLGAFTAKVMMGLTKTGVGPLIFAGIVAPVAFPMVFGREWQRAGEVVTWMTPWFVLQFISSPMSMVMHVCNRQKAMLILAVSGLIIRLGAMYLAAQFAKHYFSEFYALSGGVFYLICCCVFSKVAGVSVANVIRILRDAMIPLLSWVAAGAFLRMIFWLATP